jgi:CheY-like chemotaxis protein
MPPLPLTILVVEDNAMNEQLICNLLDYLGYDFHVSRDGREAVNACQAQRFDLILMDCQMPNMDGFEATALIRGGESSKGATRVPIVALTAGSVDVDRERCIASGMDDYLSKPFRVADVRRKLAKWL